MLCFVEPLLVLANGIDWGPSLQTLQKTLGVTRRTLEQWNIGILEQWSLRTVKTLRLTTCALRFTVFLLGTQSLVLSPFTFFGVRSYDSL